MSVQSEDFRNFNALRSRLHTTDVLNQIYQSLREGDLENFQFHVREIENEFDLLYHHIHLLEEKIGKFHYKLLSRCR